ncbi:MAG: hypothetical protein HC790_07040 [Acaryochloridaceae cyanobacterium CSU_3_4]|nr:hypothetical protein [Acaryochloridaceae cyanobacterium CSU_3_4]
MFSKKVLRIEPQLQISRVSSVTRGISITSALAMCLLIGTGCQEASKSGTEANQEQSTNAPAQSGQTLVAAFPEQVVIPTYERLVTQSEKMVTAVDAFVANPSDSALKAAQEAWTEARVPWEQSEAFAFGPATSLGYDGDLDDWPVNETDVTAVIKDTKPINLEFVSSLQTTQKDFIPLSCCCLVQRTIKRRLISHPANGNISRP